MYLVYRKIYMDDRKLDLLRIKKLLKTKGVSPQQMGSLMKQYYIKYIKSDYVVPGTHKDDVACFDNSLLA